MDPGRNDLSATLHPAAAGPLTCPAKPSAQPPCVPHRHARRALSGFKRQGQTLPLPVSPEGDHFPRTPDMRTSVLSPHPAPAPPRCHGWQCILGGTTRSMAWVLGAGILRGIGGAQPPNWTLNFWLRCWFCVLSRKSRGQGGASRLRWCIPALVC